MKKNHNFIIMGIISFCFLTGCANMAEDSDSEQMSDINESAPIVNESAPIVNESAPKKSEKKGNCSISYSTEFGIVPEKITRDYEFKMTDKELFPVYADNKTFDGWIESKTGKLINAKQKVTDDLILNAKWRNIQVGDIVLAEGPIISIGCYANVKASVHPMAIIYKSSDNKNLGISIKPIKTNWSNSNKYNFSCLEDLRTGKNCQELIKKSNPNSYSDENFPILSYAEHYIDYFKDVSNSPYKNGWYIPSEIELQNVYCEYNALNKSYEKISVKSKLLVTYSSLDGVWTSTSNGKNVIALSLVRYGNYTSMKQSLDKLNKNGTYFEKYSEIYFNIGNSDYKFFRIEMKPSKTLTAYCIREF